MITETMTRFEKMREAVLQTEMLYALYLEHIDEFKEKLKRITSSGFPYYNRYTVKDDRNNTWHMVIECPSKAYRKNGLTNNYAYTTYETTKGTAFIVFMPQYWFKYAFFYGCNNVEVKKPFVLDFLPHSIARYTQRYLTPKGLVGLTINKKVENIMRRYVNYDNEPDLHGDISAAKHVKFGGYALDLTMRNGGLFRGNLFYDIHCIQIYTYVDNNSLYDNQKERISDILKDYKKNIDPLRGKR